MNGQNNPYGLVEFQAIVEAWRIFSGITDKSDASMKSTAPKTPPENVTANAPEGKRTDYPVVYHDKSRAVVK